MSVFEFCPVTPPVLRAEFPLLDEAQLAAAAFLARYSGRTLQSDRADLRQFFQWVDDVGLAPLTATRAHLELYRAWLDARGLAASTIDRRLSTVCGHYRFAHLDGRIPANPAQYVRRPRVHPTSQRGMDRGELAGFLYSAERVSPMHAALAVLLGLNGLRVSEACGADIADLGFERGHRTLRIVGKGNKPATVPLVPRTGRTLDLAIGERTEGPILHRHDGHRLDPAPPIGGSARSATERASTTFIRTCCGPRSSWLPSTRVSRYEMSKSPPAILIRGRPPSTTDGARTTTATPPTRSSRSSPAADSARHASNHHPRATVRQPRPDIPPAHHHGTPAAGRFRSLPFRRCERRVRGGR
jgi:integrase/recombinase XerD